MKMHWGNRIIIVFVVFIGMMITMVVLTTRQKVELVDEDYYALEIAYQDRIDATTNAKNFTDSIQILKNNTQIVLQMPQTFSNSKGEVHFYKASKSDDDRKFILQIDENGNQFIDFSAIQNGNYIVKISWELGQKKYYIEKDISI